MVILHLISFVSTIALSWVLTWYVRNTALARGWGVPPATERHIHNGPVPRLGGVAIVLSFLIMTGLLLAGSTLFQRPLGFSLRSGFYILLPGLLVFLLGLYDDIHSLSPYVKFTVQVLAAVLLFWGGFRVVYLPFLLSEQSFGWLVALPLTVLWVLWITNAFNLIDGLDGLAAGSALFSTLTVFVVSLIYGNHFVSLLAVGLAGATLGFLRFNFNPATIFLGDCGALFLGFMLSALALAGAQKAPTVVAVAIPIVSFGLPILDTVLSVIRRFLRRKPLFTADREHIHHKLLEQGLTQRQVVVLLYGVSALLGLLSMLLLSPGRGAIAVVLVVLGIGIWLGVQQLGYHEFFELGRVAQRTLDQRQIIVNNLAIRRAATELSKARDFRQLCQVLEGAFAANDFDGFHLRLGDGGEARFPAHEGTLFGPPTRELSYQWWKPGADGPLTEATPAWMLELELITTQQQKCGFFSLYRAYHERALRLDINVLVSEFRVALADAVDRILHQLEEPPHHSVAVSA